MTSGHKEKKRQPTNNHGGARKGAGRKPGAAVAVSKSLKLSLTDREFARIEAHVPKDKDRAVWLREVLLAHAITVAISR